MIIGCAGTGTSWLAQASTGILVNVDWLKGEVCTSVWEPVPAGIVFAWQFDLAGLVTTCPWRLVEDGRILLARADHGQRDRGPDPIDAAGEAFSILAGRRISGGRINPLLGDIVLEFGGTRRLEVFNDSSTNEAWKMSGPKGPSLIAQRGGGVVSRR